MAIRANFKQAKINLISRTSRIWSRLNRNLNADLKKIFQSWLDKLLKQAQHDIVAGILLDEPKLSPGADKLIFTALKTSLVYGRWLTRIYIQECRSFSQGKKYRGRINLAESDENLREALIEFIHSGKWHNVIPETAINWLNNYTPILAGNLKQNILDEVRKIMRNSLLSGMTLQERMKILMQAAPELSRMTNHRIEAIARTEITRADNMGSLIEMKSNSDVLGVEFSAILDSRTTIICEERHGLIMSLDDPRLPENTPPLHVNCRSMLLPATIYEYSDGVLTSSKFNEVIPGIQRSEDIAEVQKILNSF